MTKPQSPFSPAAQTVLDAADNARIRAELLAIAAELEGADGWHPLEVE